jgi:hypothetical protein
MIGEYGDEGKTDGEGEDGGENTDEIEDMNETESKGLNCRCAIFTNIFRRVYHR